MYNQKTIAIVGGGITGLTTAYYLQKTIQKQGLPYQLKLLEASARLGGKIHTEKRDGFIIERGADSFLARKKQALRLVESLGIEENLVRNQTGQAYILHEERLHEIPKGFFMGMPMSEEALVETSLLSEKGKKRAAKEPLIPRSSQDNDQSLGYFLRYRFGDELVENLIEPLLSGIYSSDIDEMSLLSTFPNVFELEQQFGSVMKGLERQYQPRKSQPAKTPGQFLTFKNGLDTIVQHLMNEIGADVISLNKRVEAITFENEKYTIHAGDNIEADVVVMAAPHNVLSTVFPGHPFFLKLKETASSSVANVSLAFDASALEDQLNGTGFVVSRNSHSNITACTWTHKKWQHTTPKGKALLRAYLGKPSDQEIVSLSDEDMIDIVLKDLKQTMGVTQEPEFSVVTRWEKMMPQYTVGHKERLNQVRDLMNASLPGVFLAGSSYEGVGIPDCIGQAEQVVDQVFDYLSEK